jgi:Pro-kumamolisin, activation domain
VAGVSAGRTVIEFSGTAAEVQEAFHTSIHRYTVNGTDYWANASDPQIPSALTPVVAGINTLYNFPRRQMHELFHPPYSAAAKSGFRAVTPQYTFPNPCSVSAQPYCNFAVAPADFAKIYNVPNLLLSPAPAAQYNGDGVTIVIVGESDINTNDIAQFRSMFGLPAPHLNVIVSGPDPGVVESAETEADLDTEWSGAIAPNAAIDFVVAQSTEVSLGVDLAAQYAVDNNLAPILSESFGICEYFMGTADNTLAPEASKIGIAYELFNPTNGVITNPNATTVVFGKPSLLRVNVTSQAGDACASNAPGNAGCPSGSVTLTDSYNGGSTAPLNGGAFALNAQGYTEDQMIDPQGGTHVFTATYTGDNSYTAATPANQRLTITTAPTTTTVTSGQASALFGQAVALTVSIFAQNIVSSIAPTGTVDLLLREHGTGHGNGFREC